MTCSRPHPRRRGPITAVRRTLDNVEAISPEWLTAFLRDYGTLGADGEVSRVEPERLDAGFVALSHRLRLDYAGAHSSAPTSLIVKLAASRAPIRVVAVANGFYLREAYFYARIAGRAGLNAGIRVPEC